MSTYLKPQSPLYHKEENAYFYPLTTTDQVIMDDGSRLNAKMLTVDVHNANEAEPNGINADKLGGYDASEYIRKDQASVEVNYSVVGSLTEPENRTQNMIWLETNTPIGKVFIGDSRPNEAFIDGDTWIKTGAGSRALFNTLKIGNNYTNMVCPLIAKQMISGNLVDVTAKSWQNGEWVDWVSETWLFQYSKGEIVSFYQGLYGYGSITSNSQCIDITTPADTCGSVWITDDSYDLTEASTVVMVAKCTNLSFSPDDTWYGKCIVTETKHTEVTAIPNWVARVNLIPNSQRTEYKLDVSTLPPGKYYIGFWGQANVEIYDLYFTNEPI